MKIVGDPGLPRSEALPDLDLEKTGPLIQERDSSVRSRWTTNLRQLPFGKILGNPPGKLSGGLRIEPLAKRDGRALELLLPGVDECLENAVPMFTSGPNRGEALSHKGEIVDLTKRLTDRF